MVWLYLSVAIVFEIAWAIGMKYTDGLTKPWPSALTLVGSLLSVGFLAQVVASRTAGALPLGTAYAMWTGVGAVGTGALGMALFGESTHPARVGCLLLIVAGVVGLELTAGE